MPQGIIRAAIVGASSLLGKELAEQLNVAAAVQWDIKLFDKEDAVGQMAAAGDEALVIQPISSDSFTGVEIAFFAGDVLSTREYWRNAVSAGASVVDLTGALEGESNVSVRCPLLGSASKSTPLDLSSAAVVSAHPAAIMLGSVLVKLHAAFAPIQASATVLEPASQHGSAGLDELHQQTVNLLSFKSLPQEVFDSQVAFNLATEFGTSARVDLRSNSETIQRHVQEVAGDSVARSMTLQVVQAPVFSGYTASVFIAMTSSVKAHEVAHVLDSDPVRIPALDEPSPSNQAAAQEGQIMVRVRSPEESSAQPNGLWLWMATDNLRLAARNAIACAAELIALRPGTRLQ